MLKTIRKGARIIVRRLRAQGWRTTALWAYARGVPYITGVPILRYSRVTPALYVGPQHRANGKRALTQAGIAYILNMRSEFDDAAHNLTLDAPPDGSPADARASYCHLPTPDDEAPSMAHLAQGIAFIESAIDSGGKVYIHCSAGVGRAPTMAAAYLIRRGYGADAALDLIRSARPFIAITPPQMRRLRELEALQTARPDSVDAPNSAAI